MDMELTNEAAEVIGQYRNGGKERLLAELLEKGGIARREVEPAEPNGIIPGYERVFYYTPEGQRVAIFVHGRARVSAKAEGRSEYYYPTANGIMKRKLSDSGGKNNH